MKFFATFPCIHPLGNYYLVIDAKNEEEAREQMFGNFGSKWAFLYEEKEFDKSFYPKGKIGEINE